MIGRIKDFVIFEFRDEGELAKALSVYGTKYNCNTLLIVDTSDYIKGVIYNDSFTFMPNLNEDAKYYLYGYPDNKSQDFSRNDPLPQQYSWELGPMPFSYYNIRIPKDIGSL